MPKASHILFALTFTATLSAQYVPYPIVYVQSILQGAQVSPGPIVLFESGQFASQTGNRIPTGGPFPLDESLRREAEVVDAIQENIEVSSNAALTCELSAILNAMRFSENGGAGQEFGSLRPSDNTYRKQAGQAAYSLRAHLDRFMAGWDRIPINGKMTVVYGAPRPCPQPGGVGPNGEPCPSFEDFIESFAKRWAPKDAENDPNGLNEKWPGNVTHFYHALRIANDFGPCSPKK